MVKEPSEDPFWELHYLSIVDINPLLIGPATRTKYSNASLSVTAINVLHHSPSAFSRNHMSRGHHISARTHWSPLQRRVDYDCSRSVCLGSMKLSTSKVAEALPSHSWIA